MKKTISSLQKCINTINPKTLTLEEELKLGEIIQGEGTKAEKENSRWSLVLGYSLYFAKFIKSICRDEEKQADMFQTALLIAYRASAKFDPSQGRSFKSLISQNLKKELLNYQSVTFDDTKSSAEVYKLVAKYNKLNNGREPMDYMTAEEFAEKADIKLDYAQEIVFKAKNEGKNIRIDNCYRLGDADDSEDLRNASCGKNTIGSYILSAGKNYDFEVTMKQLDSFLDVLLKNDEKKYVWMSRLGINCESKSCQELSMEIGRSEGAVRHLFNNTNKKVMDHIEPSLYLSLRSFLAA